MQKFQKKRPAVFLKKVRKNRISCKKSKNLTFGEYKTLFGPRIGRFFFFFDVFFRRFFMKFATFTQKWVKVANFRKKTVFFRKNVRRFFRKIDFFKKNIRPEKNRQTFFLKNLHIFKISAHFENRQTFFLKFLHIFLKKCAAKWGCLKLCLAFFKNIFINDF